MRLKYTAIAAALLLPLTVNAKAKYNPEDDGLRIEDVNILKKGDDMKVDFKMVFTRPAIKTE